MRVSLFFVSFLLLLCAECASTRQLSQPGPLCDLVKGVQLSGAEANGSVNLMDDYEHVVDVLGTPNESFDTEWFCTWSDRILEGTSRKLSYSGLELSLIETGERAGFRLHEIKISSEGYALICDLKLGDSLQRLNESLGPPAFQTTNGDTGNPVLKYRTTPGDSRAHFEVGESGISRIRAFTSCTEFGQGRPMAP